MKLQLRKNWQWLWLIPSALSWLLLALARPAGGAASWVELAIIGACSCLCGFALAMKSFSTFKQRFVGGLFFSGGSLCLIGSVVFMGCFLPVSEARMEKERQQWETQRKAQVASQIVPRDAQAGPTMLDLTAFYDRLLPGQFTWKQPGVHAMPPGTHTWGGVKFDVRGIIEAQNQPHRRITGLPVGQKCSVIYFLSGAGLGFNQTNVASMFILHYASGITEPVPLLFGHDLAVSHYGANSAALNLAMTNSVVWAEKDSTNGGRQPVFLFYIKKWNNPFPTDTVATIDFVPSSPAASPFLVAVTVQPVNP